MARPMTSDLRARNPRSTQTSQAAEQYHRHGCRRSHVLRRATKAAPPRAVATVADVTDVVSVATNANRAEHSLRADGRTATPGTPVRARRSRLLFRRLRLREPAPVPPGR